MLNIRYLFQIDQFFFTFQLVLSGRFKAQLVTACKNYSQNKSKLTMILKVSFKIVNSKVAFIHYLCSMLTVDKSHFLRSLFFFIQQQKKVSPLNQSKQRQNKKILYTRYVRAWFRREFSRLLAERCLRLAECLDAWFGLCPSKRLCLYFYFEITKTN